MSNERQISELVNAISERTLEQEVIILKKRIQRTYTPSFIMGYCATDISTFEQVVRYTQEQVTQYAQQPLEVTLNPNLRNLRDYFLLRKEEMQSTARDIILVKARGFERLSALNAQSGIRYRVAHDYDQGLCEDEKNTFIGLDKKVLVITHIDPSSGEEAYEVAVRSACQSQFKSFLYEFKKVA